MRKPARERQKARARREYNRAVRVGRHYDNISDLVAPLALSLLASRRAIHHPRKP